MNPQPLIIFDWDGTIVQSEPRIVASFHAAIAHTGMEARSDEAIRNLIGLGLLEAIQQLYPAADLVTHEAVKAAYRVHYLEHNTLPTPVYPGAREALTALHTSGYPLAIATGKSRAGLNRALQETGLAAYFSASRTADETCSKPDPRMLHELLAETGYPATRALMVGDTEYDVHMAAQAGMASLAVSYGAHDCARLRAYQPLACLDSLAELPGWLSSHHFD